MRIIYPTLKETCDLIFKRHKENDGRLLWNKSTFNDEYPNNLQDAKTLLLQEKTIVPDKHNQTMIALEYKDCENYDEVIEIIRLRKKQQSSYEYNSVHIIGNQNVVGNTQSSFDKALNADHNNKPETKKRRITVESILKFITAIIVATLAVLKGCHVI